MTVPPPQPSHQELDLLRFNIRGRRFEIQRHTATKFPNSIFGLLASHEKEGREYLLKSKGIFLRTAPDQVEEWFVERPITAFGLILDYMCLGRLHCPSFACKELVKSELIFWRMFDVPLPDCCWDDEDEDLDEKEEQERCSQA